MALPYLARRYFYLCFYVLPTKQSFSQHRCYGIWNCYLSKENAEWPWQALTRADIMNGPNGPPIACFMYSALYSVMWTYACKFIESITTTSLALGNHVVPL